MTISAKIIADSISEQGIRLTTLQLRYPRFIHAEFMTHRVFSRNASSSRAIPVKRLIQDIVDDPVYPSYWGANQKGMQAGEEIANEVLTYDDGLRVFKDKPEKAWDIARLDAIKWAQRFDEAGYHKQIVNRLLEPFSHINIVVTATEWANFFHLRCHPDAQPEMRMLAEVIRDAMAASTPNLLEPGKWHLPYKNDEMLFAAAFHLFPNQKIVDQSTLVELLIKLSVARCARVSYLTTEGKTPTIEEDLALYDRLVGSTPLHASPAEHQATPDTLIPAWNGAKTWKNPKQHGNFTGWIQYRKTLPGENIEG